MYIVNILYLTKTVYYVLAFIELCSKDVHQYIFIFKCFTRNIFLFFICSYLFICIQSKNVYKKYDIQLSERTVLNNKRNI